MQKSRPCLVFLLSAAGLALALVLAPAVPARATPGQIYEVKRPVVNLRAGPSTTARVIGRLRRGDRLMEFSRRGIWIKVQQMGKLGPEGWVHGGLIAPEALQPEAAPAPAVPPRSDAGDSGTGGGDDVRTVYVYPRHPFAPGVLRGRDTRLFVPGGLPVIHLRKGPRPHRDDPHGAKSHGDDSSRVTKKN